jgi:hypothetical protein
MKIENRVFISLNVLLFQLINKKSMFVAWHSDINSPKSGLFHLTGQLITQLQSYKSQRWSYFRKKILRDHLRQTERQKNRQADI